MRQAIFSTFQGYYNMDVKCSKALKLHRASKSLFIRYKGSDSIQQVESGHW